MILNNNPYRVISPPMKVHFLGWTSDTYTLQRFGWEISVNENPYYGSIQIAIRHQGLKLKAISDMVSCDYHRVMVNEYDQNDILQQIEFNFMNMSSNYNILIQNRDIMDFHPIDAEPTMVNLEYKSLDDLNIFKKVQVIPENEIIVDPLTINQLMDEIIRLQTPKQKEIRERRMKARKRGELTNSPLENTETVCNLVKLVA